jgi:hypothetical protein
MTITVPSEHDLAQAARDVTIYCRLADAKGKTGEVVASLAREYSLEAGVVESIRAQMSKLMENYDLRKITRDLTHGR